MWDRSHVAALSSQTCFPCPERPLEFKLCCFSGHRRFSPDSRVFAENPGLIGSFIHSAHVHGAPSLCQPRAEPWGTVGTRVTAPCPTGLSN